MAGEYFIDRMILSVVHPHGVGAEYWRIILKLSANGYIRATGWKKSPDVEDYQERPANGWIFVLRGYLPAWPQRQARCMNSIMMKSGCLVKINAERSTRLPLK